MEPSEIVKMLERRDQRIKELQEQLNTMRQEVWKLKDLLQESLLHVKQQLAHDGARFTGDPEVLNDHINSHPLVQKIEESLKSNSLKSNS